jgi:Flp pilus assembly protein TadD
MNVQTNPMPTRAGQLGSILSIAYTELQYWLLGLTPESYHWAQGSAWERLGRYRHAAHHLARYLQSSENTHVRALLAFCYVRIGSWADAAREYSAVLDVWPDPSIAINLAHAQLQLGNTAHARQLVALVEAEHSPLEGDQQLALAALKRQLESASNKTIEPTR